MNTRNMDSKNIFRLILAFVITAFLACGCSKEDPFEGPLGLQSRKIVLPAETGITPIMVFSNTTWTVSMTPKVSWAGIDRLSGKGSSGLYFSYAANYGEAREVTLAFEAGGVRDSVVVVQNAAQ
jgi:hypothetical protein